MAGISVGVGASDKKWHLIYGLASLLLGTILFIFETNTFFHMELTNETEAYTVNGAGLIIMIFGLFAAIAALVRYNHGSKPVMKSFIFVAIGVGLALVPIVVETTWEICAPGFCFPFLYWLAITGMMMAIFASGKIMVRSYRSGY